jgi:hypothetical protein
MASVTEAARKAGLSNPTTGHSLMCTHVLEAVDKFLEGCSKKRNHASTSSA